jgi:hypothetical protein
VPLVLAEFTPAAHDYAIVFVEAPEGIISTTTSSNRKNWLCSGRTG